MIAEIMPSRFTHAVEAEYARRAAAHQRAGLNTEDAHVRALEEAKQLEREALEELGRRGLFPWSGAELNREGGPDVR